MGLKKTQESSQSTHVRGASDQERQLRALLQTIAQNTSGQLGDLTDLANGLGLEPTDADRERAGQIAQSGFEQQQREIESSLEDSSRRLEGGLLSRGIEGSSIEAVDRALLEREALRQTDDARSQRASTTQQLLFNAPLQRAQTQLGANQTLFNRLLGAANPVLQGNLSERLTGVSVKGKNVTSGLSQAEFLQGVGSIVPGSIGG